MHTVTTTPQPLRKRRILGTFAIIAGLAGATSCGTEVTKYESVHLEIKSEPPSSGTIAFLDIAALRISSDDQDPTKKFEDGEKVKSLRITLPADADITGKGYLVEIKQPAASQGSHVLRVLGLDDKEKTLTTFSGVIDTGVNKLHKILLKAPNLDCDSDGDGAKDCSKDGCCAPGEVGDCNDKVAAANPFATENACTQCGNSIDEDCDGKDTPCVDSDKDGVADCIEDQTCGGDAKNDKDVYPPRNDPKVAPGAPEVCDGKDNDCDGKIDEDLDYIGIDGTKGNKSKGDSCGSGACAGGKVICDPKNPAQLVCDSAGKKKDKELCDNDADDDCNGKVNDGCALKDIDGDGVNSDDEDKACANKHAKFHPEFGTSQTHKDYEAKHCCAVWTKEILAKHKDWKKTSDADFGVPKDVAATKALLSACDFDCDGAIEPCAHDDKDGDGVPAGLDCKDEDPTVYPSFSGAAAAPEKCGDGVDQDCIGGDEKCSDDKDGDGYNSKHDCNDDDKAVNPGAPELCNGVDDDCDGVVDDGNAEAADAVCGDKDGECGKQPGVTVCKHWPAEQEPSALDCLKKKLDETSRTCVGCEGDKRPTEDLCDYLDNDCDGQSDEDYSYDKQAGKKLKVGEKCDGVGECGAGTVECHVGKKHATCSTDPDGTKKQNKVEICDNKDNNCDGQTDETLTAIADASCRKKGRCAGSSIQQLKTVCKAGKWVCDYGKVSGIEFDSKKTCAPGEAGCHCPGLGDKCHPLHELTCDGKDNDCNGQTDEDFDYWDTVVGGSLKKLAYGDGNTACGTGACNGGKVVCNKAGDGLTCSTITKTAKEICDAIDNDCNGKTDDAMTIDDSNCKVAGVCTKTNVKALCTKGKWVCDYSAIKDHEGPTSKSCPFSDAKCKFDGSVEKSCDGKDNDCDGKTDEDFDYTNIGDGGTATKLSKGGSCGTGECKGGTVVCNKAGDGLTCDTIDKKATDVCDYKDNDCDGFSDEDYTYVEHGSAKSLKVGDACDGIGTCGKGTVECLSNKNAVTCSTDPNGSKSEAKTKEDCDDLDNDCDKIVDEGCDDDGDKYCDSAMYTPAKPKTCPNGGGDCKDKDANFNPGVPEACDGLDNNCNGQTDEVFFWTIPYDKETGKSGKLGIGKSCGLGACAGGTITCNSDQKGVHCTTFGPGKDAKNKPETLCDDIDNDCDGLTDEGCDDDGDKYCDDGMTTVGKPKACPLGGGDCNDDPDKGGKEVFPSHAELCNDIDDNCNKSVDEACDKDGDGYCDKDKVTIGKPKVCPKGGGDCNDHATGGKEIYPTHPEWCDDVDQDCNNKIDEGCDDDGDKYCDKWMPWKFSGSGAPKICPNGNGDCDDGDSSFHPGATEICDGKDQDCNTVKDDKCNQDGDGYCDKGRVVVGKPAVCLQGGGDCDDKDKAVHPAAQEVCNNKDDDCDNNTDAKDTDLAKARPNCGIQAGVCKGSKKPVSLCQGGVWKDCTATHYKAYSTKYDSNPVESFCDDLDNDCDGKVDIGCDGDGDGYCTDSRTTVGKPKVCPKGGGDCNDTNSSTGKSVNPGVKEDCATPWDDNCNSTTNDQDAKGCIIYYRDLDEDGYGSQENAAPQCRCDKAGKWTALKPGDCDDFSKGESSWSWTDAKGNKRPIGSVCGLGECAGGTVQCNGKVATCGTYFGSGNKKSDEVCDNKDNDCNGKTDDKPTLKLKSCSNKGECKGKGVVPECLSGKEVCDYASNVGSYSKVDDSCDDKDNDCDGKTDENADVSAFPCSNKGVCGTANIVAKCVKGNPKCDYSGISGWQDKENKCDGKDNDCDGDTDESPDLSALTCSNKGVCNGEKGDKKCVNGKGICEFSKVKDWQSVETKCDNKDNDCDGKTDGLSDMSQPNDCAQGVCTADKVKGTCTAGKWTCDYTGVPLYKAETKTDAPTCSDGKDNDCDGDKDGKDDGCK